FDSGGRQGRSICFATLHLGYRPHGRAFRSHRYAARRIQAERFRGGRNRLRGCNRVGCDATDSGRSAGGGRQTFKLGPDQSIIHGGARRGIRGVVSDNDGVGGFFGGEQSVRSGGSVEGARDGERVQS